MVPSNPSVLLHSNPAVLGKKLLKFFFFRNHKAERVQRRYILSGHMISAVRHCHVKIYTLIPGNLFRLTCFVIQPLIVRPNVVMRRYFRMRKLLCSMNIVGLVAWERDEIVL